MQSIQRRLWSRVSGAQQGWRAPLWDTVRFVTVMARDLRSGDLTLRSMSLVYTTLLSIVPLLALSFSVLKAFGVHNQIEPMLRNFLAPLGPAADDITLRIVQFIQNMNIGVLGAAGLAFLIYTAISLMQKVEESFNFIWHIAQARSLGERFSRYLSVLLIGPILVFSALGITATVLDSQIAQGILTLNVFSPLIYVLGKLMPYLLIIGAFTFVYSFIPNTRVRLGPALTAGIFAGILWQSAGWAFALFVAASTRYSAIYSSFAVLVLFMIWLYISWLILLFGASMSFYLQRPEYLTIGRERRLSNRMHERVALAIMTLVGENYMQGRPPWTLGQLAGALGVPEYSIDDVLAALHTAGLLMLSDTAPPAYLPARDLRHLSVKELLDIVRSSGEDGYLDPSAVTVPRGVVDLVQQSERQSDATLAGISIASLTDAAALGQDNDLVCQAASKEATGVS